MPLNTPGFVKGALTLAATVTLAACASKKAPPPQAPPPPTQRPLRFFHAAVLANAGTPRYDPVTRSVGAPGPPALRGFPRLLDLVEVLHRPPAQGAQGRPQGLAQPDVLPKHNRVARWMTEYLIRKHKLTRVVCIAKEVTKLHETFLIGPAADVQARLATTSLKGEFVVLIAPTEFEL